MNDVRFSNSRSLRVIHLGSSAGNNLGHGIGVLWKDSREGRFLVYGINEYVMFMWKRTRKRKSFICVRSLEVLGMHQESFSATELKCFQDEYFDCETSIKSKAIPVTGLGGL
jgi:hypothetical protein